MNKKSLSVVLATYNEASNIERCLEAVKGIADEIIIVDGTSTDKTIQIAKELGAKVIVTDNPPIFHINKQKALQEATSDWVLQLDADEVVSPELGKEIASIIQMSDTEMAHYQTQLLNKKLFTRHTNLLEARDGKIGTTSAEYVAFFVARKNYFLGRYLRYGGVYPDGVIRLVKKGKARFPAKSVHEQMMIEGRVGWLQNDLLHMDSPTFSKYIMRWKRYTKLFAEEIREEAKQKSVLARVSLGFGYLFLRPVHWFITTYFRHKGFLDSWQGFVFSLFSSLRFPMSYIRYLHDEK